MTRAELIEEVVLRNPGVNPKVVEFAVKRMISYMVASLVAGHRIEVRGFGSFGLRLRNPRKARNPKTGELVMTGLKHVLFFKPGKSLRERVNDSEYELVDEE